MKEKAKLCVQLLLLSSCAAVGEGVDLRLQNLWKPCSCFLFKLYDIIPVIALCSKLKGLFSLKHFLFLHAIN